jgi:hypothetical protein
MNDKIKDSASGRAASIAEQTNITIDQIRKLAEFDEQGGLTDEEFTAMTTALLSRL